MAGCGKKMKKGGSVDKDFEKYVSKKVAEDNKKEGWKAKSKEARDYDEIAGKPEKPDRKAK